MIGNVYYADKWMRWRGVVTFQVIRNVTLINGLYPCTCLEGSSKGRRIHVSGYILPTLRQVPEVKAALLKVYNL